MDYRRRTADLPVSIQKKELERLIIELSWKSSKIEAMPVFYELNSITPFKKIFIDQYDFAVKNYAVK